MPTPVVSIIVVNWNGREHLADCLDSLAEQTYRDFEVILVDNGSHDDSVPFVQDRYSWVKVVSLPSNIGFASGNNRGLEHASGAYIVTLNNDTRACPDWLERLVRAAEAHPRAGMVGCRICSFKDPELIDSVGMGFCRDGMSRGMNRNRRWSELRMSEIEEILLPSACAALYRRAMIDEIGFFDDDFFAYAEDSDLGLRGRLAGWQAILASRAVVYHKYSQSSGSLSAFKVYLVERNHYWVAMKNFSPGGLMALPWFTLLRYLEQVRTVLLGRGSGSEFRGSDSQAALIRALVKAVCDGLRGMPRMLRKRRHVMGTRRLTWQEYSELLRTHRITFKELLDND